MRIKCKSVTILILYLYAFFLLYAPEIGTWLPIPTIYLQAIIAAVNIIRYNRRLVKVFLNNKQMMIMCIGVILSIIYTILISAYKGKSIYAEFALIVQIINVTVLIIDLKKQDYTIDKMVKFILNIVVIQAIICVLMLFITDFRQIAIDLYVAGAPLKASQTLKRIYGISNGYTYSTPIFNGIIGVLATTYALYVSPKYIWYVPVIIIPIMLNGRTGLAILLIGTCIVYLFTFLTGKKIIRIIGYAVISILIGILSMTILKDILPTTYLWIEEGIQEVIALLQGNTVGTFSALNDTMWTIPEGWALFTGEGVRVFGNNGYINGIPISSDIGFVNDLYIGGIIYVILLYTGVIKFITTGILYGGKEIIGNRYVHMNRLLSIAFIVILFIANYKGECMREGKIITIIIMIKVIFLHEIGKIKL